MANPVLIRIGLNIVSQSHGRDRISMRIYKAHFAALAVANLSIAGAVASHVASSMAGIRNALAQTQRRLRANNVNVHFDVDHFEQIKETLWNATKHKAVAAVNEAERALRDVEVFKQHEQKVARLREDIDGMDLGKISARAEELGYDILGEMRRRLFLVIDVDKASYFEQSSGSPFGEAVANAFPRSAQDVAAGSRCLALNEWTAAVTHSCELSKSPCRPSRSELGSSFQLRLNWRTGNRSSTRSSAGSSPRHGRSSSNRSPISATPSYSSWVKLRCRCGTSRMPGGTAPHTVVTTMGSKGPS